jgi:hypothetical protein
MAPTPQVYYTHTYTPTPILHLYYTYQPLSSILTPIKPYYSILTPIKPYSSMLLTPIKPYSSILTSIKPYSISTEAKALSKKLDALKLSDLEVDVTSVKLEMCEELVLLRWVRAVCNMYHNNRHNYTQLYLLTTHTTPINMIHIYTQGRS